MSKNILEFIAEGSMKDNIISFLRTAFGKKKTAQPKPKPTYSIRVRSQDNKPFKWEHLNPAKQTQREVMKAKAAYVLGVAKDSFEQGKAAGASEIKKATANVKRAKILDKTVKKQKSKMSRAKTAAKKLDSPIEKAELKAKAKPDSWHTRLEKEKAPKLKKVLKNRETLTPGALKAAQVLQARADKKKSK